MLRKHSLFLSVLYTLLLSVLSIIKLDVKTPNLPLNSDKIAHVLAHFLFVILWFLTFHYKIKIKFNKAILYAVLFSIPYGVLIEGLQGLLTLSRESDVNDVIANVLGAVFAVLLLLSLKKRILKKNNSLLF